MKGVALRAKAKRQHRRVGERVGISISNHVYVAKITEDRGNLGVEGQQVVRLHVPALSEGDESYDVEVPVDWLRPAPRP